MARTADTDAALNVLLARRGVGPATHRRVLALARDLKCSLSELLTRGASALPPPVRAALKSLSDPRGEAEALLARLAARGVGWVVDGTPDYPARLTDALDHDAPVVLFTRGNARLLAGRMVAAVGSRKPGRRSQHFLATVCRRISAAGVTIVSGGARGIDATAHAAALETGDSVMVLPVGLDFMAKTPALAGVDTAPGEHLCVISQFPPDADWQSPQAIMRNRIIVALAEWVIAVEPRDRGGTWSSAQFAIQMHRPLFVVGDFAVPERRRAISRLVRAGATALGTVSVPDAAQLQQIADSVLAAPRPVQSRLFGDQT